MKQRKRKLYQTRNTLFYAKPTIVSRLIQLWEAHEKRYKQEPKVIYMTKKEWEDYEEEVCRNPQIRYIYATRGYPRTKFKGIEFHCVAFRGIPVIAIL